MKSRNRSRLSIVLLVTLSLATGLLSACNSAPASPGQQEPAQLESEKGNLVILDWAGYDDPMFSTTFAEAYPDVSVETTYFETDPDALAKVQSGFSFDIIHPCSSWWGLYVENGLVQPIDTSRLSNWPDVNPDMAKLGEFNGQQYFVPYDWGYESILARSDKIDKVPTSWADLWDPAYAGRLSIPDNSEVAFIITALALGFEDPWSTTPEQDEMIKQKLIELKPNILTFWIDSTELAQMMGSGDVWVAGAIWQDTYGLLVDEGTAVEYIDPAEGRLGWVCGHGISSQSENTDLAYEYLDALLDPESIANLANEFWYGASSQKAIEFMDPAVVEQFQLNDPDVLKETVFYQTLTAEDRQKITTIWDEVKIAP